MHKSTGVGGFCGLKLFGCNKSSSVDLQVEKSALVPRTVKNKPIQGEKTEGIDGFKDNKGEFTLMMELRKKILVFRDIIDLLPCDGSITINNLLIITTEDLHKIYPEILPKELVSDIEIDKVLLRFCYSLRHIRDSWMKNQEWIDIATQNMYGNGNQIDSDELVETAMATLDCIIDNLPKDKFNTRNEDDMSSDSSLSSTSRFCDTNSACCNSPLTPASVLPDSLGSAGYTNVTCPSPLLRSLRAQAVGKLNPIDVKRLSFHMFPYVEAKDHGDLNQENPDQTIAETGEAQSFQETIATGFEDSVSYSEICGRTDNGTIEATIGIIDTSEMTLPKLLPNVTGVTNPQPPPSESLQQNLMAIQSSKLPLPSSPQLPSSTFQPGMVSMVPPIPPPALPILRPSSMKADSALPPPPPTQLPFMSTIAKASLVAPLPLPPPPPPPPLQTSGSAKATPPPPPPPMISRKGSPLFPPPPAPPMPMGKGAAPPPPPPGVARSLRPKKAQTKLKRSSQMGSLYRVLKEKVEGGNQNARSSNGRKASASSASGKQGMADALAEMTKRSAYFQQIEEDVRKHAKTISKLKVAISSFKTNDMTELTSFHKRVESILEQLTDETQVLSRFEGFPHKKLETLRMATALYSKLYGIVSELHKWKMEGPLGQLLDKTESYFAKIKGDIDAMERTKDEESKKFQSHSINFDFHILVQIKEAMVDVSSDCMEFALQERRKARAENDATAAANGSKLCESKKRSNGGAKMLWRAFQFAYKVYTFAGGHDDRADTLTRELAHEIETGPHRH